MHTELTNHYRFATSVARCYLDSPEDVYDAVQTAMLKALQAPTDVQDWRKWIAKIVRNTCFDMRKRHYRKCEVVDICDVDRADHRQCVSVVIERETIAELRKAIGERNWQVVMLFQSGYSYEEIGVMLGKNANATKQMATRAKEAAQRLRAASG